jgi:hypothetical protein
LMKYPTLLGFLTPSKLVLTLLRFKKVAT